MKVVDRRKESFTVGIARGGPLGNPFSHLPRGKCQADFEVNTVQDAIAAYKSWMNGDKKISETFPQLKHPYWERRRTEAIALIKTLKEDAVLGCYCKKGNPCHGQVIIELWVEYTSQP